MTTKENRQNIERENRVYVFAHKSQREIDWLVASMSQQEREQLKRDISELTMTNCSYQSYEASSLIDRALTPYGLGVFSKLILPKYCPDCGFERDNHNPNCPQFVGGRIRPMVIHN